jgi:cell division protein FtsI (penicillin-binding protein 3)
MSKGFASSYRIVLLASGLFLCFGALGVRLVWLHVIDRDSLLKTIVRSRTQLIVEQAKRGDIRDRNGGILATSHSRIVLGIDPAAVRPQDEKKFGQLAGLIGVPEAEIRRIASVKFRAVTPKASEVEPATANPTLPLKLTFAPTEDKPPSDAKSEETTATGASGDEDTDIDPTPDESGRRLIRWARLCEDISEEVNNEVQKLGLKCIVPNRVYRRAYPNNQLASHVLGYVNRQQEPVSGIEAYADFYLRGQNGWSVGERDGRGRPLAQFSTRKVPPADGYSVYLSIDTIVQDIVEQELDYIARTFQPLKATIIVSDPQTGFIWGLGNCPTFDPNEYNKVPKDEIGRMKNVAVADIYDPGSVFKIVPAAAALEERLVKPYSIFDCTLETVTHRGTVVSLPAEDHPMGRLSVAEIISHSSNKGAAQLGLLLGEDKLYHYARAFGFGSKLGYPGGIEVSGKLNPYKSWRPIDITRIPMGHSISSTVLQMHQAMSVIAADGMLLRPQIIQEVRDASGELVYRFGRDEMGRAVSEEVARTVALMLTGVTKKGGTAMEAAIDGFDVAGKTGTSQKLIDGDYSNKHHVASFVGFFPAAHPLVAISVVVDDADHRAPNGVAYGRTVAAPSFKRIGERLIPILSKIKSQREPSTSSSGLLAANEGGRR